MKNAALKYCSALLAVVILLSIFSIPVFTAPVSGRYYNTDPHYTSVSNTYGFSTGNFTGNYYYSGSPSNNAIILGEARGGAISSFYTELFVFLWDAINVSERENSDTTSGVRLLSATINVSSNDIIGGANGYVEATSYAISNTSDMWQYNYLYYWSGAQAGWN